MTGPEDRKAKALAALHRLQRLPHLMRSPLPPDVIRSTLFLIGPWKVTGPGLLTVMVR